MTIKDLERLLRTKTPKQIFGANPDKVFQAYSVLCHPDMTGGDDSIFQLLNTAYEALNEKIVITNLKTGVTYETGSPIYDGDISSYHQANNFLLKISKHPKANSYIESEAKICNELWSPDNLIFNKLLPKCVDSFPIKDDSKVNLICSVFEREDIDNLYSLEYIRSQPKYSDGLHIADFAWMFNRLLSVLGYIHKHGYVHGAIIPEHFLANISTHGGTIIGLTHAVKAGEIVKLVSNKYKSVSYYPREILENKPVKPETDLYMAGKLGIMMLGGESKIHPRILSFLKGISLEKINARPDDAWLIHDEFNDLLKQVVGKRHFRPFTI